jgi:hypothetical protein
MITIPTVLSQAVNDETKLKQERYGFQDMAWGTAPCIEYQFTARDRSKGQRINQTKGKADDRGLLIDKIQIKSYLNYVHILKEERKNCAANFYLGEDSETEHAAK